MAMAPPLTFSLSPAIANSFCTASACAANASFTCTSWPPLLATWTHLNEVHLLERHAGRLERGAHGGRRSDAHDGRVAADRVPRDEARQGRQVVRLDGRLRRDDQ